MCATPICDLQSVQASRMILISGKIRDAFVSSEVTAADIGSPFLRLIEVDIFGDQVRHFEQVSGYSPLTRSSRLWSAFGGSDGWVIGISCYRRLLYSIVRRSEEVGFCDR